MLGTTEIKLQISTSRTIRHRRNFKILRLIFLVVASYAMGYLFFFATLAIDKPLLALGIFLTGYLIGWIKHGRVYQRVIKTLEYRTSCGYSLPKAWSHAGRVICP
jgi:predicted MPP superfamily phosphohydrolase